MKTILGVLLGVTLSSAAWGAEQLAAGDTAWMLTASALVLFMTIPGLALFYGGLVRAKNVLSILMQCFSITCLVSILWLIVAYSLAFAEGNAYVGGLQKVLFSGVLEDSMTGTIPETNYAMFQLTFAIITPALIVGGFAERIKFPAVLLFTSAWLLLVYAPVAHWVWGGGWLAQMGMLDFAGGTVVHLTAGVAAVTAALMMGARRGFPETLMTPHNMTMCVMGAGMLWVGWFGFNGGSALAANGDAAMAVLVTHLSASAGAFTWMGIEWIRYGKPTALGVATGMVAGLATITPASGYVGPAGALLIGIAGGTVCFTLTNFMKRVLRVDDSLDVFPVHAVGGALGTILTGIFGAASLGVFSGQGLAMGIASQLGVQVIGVLAIGTYSLIVSYVLLKLVDAMVGLRVSDEEETEGLDLVMHDERGYDF